MGEIIGVRQGALLVPKTPGASGPLRDQGIALRIERSTAVPERYFNPPKESS